MNDEKMKHAAMRMDLAEWQKERIKNWMLDNLPVGDVFILAEPNIGDWTIKVVGWAGQDAHTMLAAFDSAVKHSAVCGADAEAAEEAYKRLREERDQCHMILDCCIEDQFKPLPERVAMAVARAEAAEAENARLRQELAAMNNWRPIETAPVDGTVVLIYAAPQVYCSDLYPQKYAVAAFREDEWMIEGTNNEWEVWYSTHWMPLPNPPGNTEFLNEQLGKECVLAETAEGEIARLRKALGMIDDARAEAVAKVERLRQELERLQELYADRENDLLYEALGRRTAEDALDAVRQALGAAAPISVVDEVARLSEARGVGCQCGNEAAQRLDALDEQMDEIEKRIDALVVEAAKKFNQTERRLDALKAAAASANRAWMDEIEQRLSDHERMKERITILEERLDRRLDATADMLDGVWGKLRARGVPLETHDGD